ncbi:MAG: hypothetical protein KGI11_09850 [Thaumarchaeota archaeon]|nr:hypothetical protein [Nitrososphaerota archaeon]
MPDLFPADAFRFNETASAESEGFELSARLEFDYDSGTPWEREDGHGPVSDWTTRDKQAGELVLAADRRRGSRRYYDFREACKLALRDGWGARKAPEGASKRQVAAIAAREDYETLRAWCNDEWKYCGVIVTASREGINLGSASVWGIEIGHPADPDNAYAAEVADELAPEAIADARAKLAALSKAS